MESAPQKRSATKTYRATENSIEFQAESEELIQNVLVYGDFFQANPMGFFVAQTPCPARCEAINPQQGSSRRLQQIRLTSPSTRRFEHSDT